MDAHDANSNCPPGEPPPAAGPGHGMEPLGGFLGRRLWQPPFLRAPEASGNIFRVILLAALAPLAAGVFFFGWRALLIAVLCVCSCMLFESAYYRLTKTPALLGRSHAALTGLLLALTLPAFVPWYVPVVGALFAIVVGKAFFGGVGHFLWQPALVGRLAVAVIFAPTIWPVPLLNSPTWPVLAQSRVILGDVTEAKAPAVYTQWRGTPAPAGADAFKLTTPTASLRELTMPETPPAPKLMTVLRRMPPAGDVLCGAVPGGIGETCGIAILLAGLYLVYRHYVQLSLPLSFILAAAATAAIAPIQTDGGSGWRWLPFLAEGSDAGFAYVSFHVFSGELLLAAWFLATEMTSRPVTAPGQTIFGILCGVITILLRHYTGFPMPAYGAVLIMNTFTPVLDNIRPRVLGRAPWWRRHQNAARTGN